MGMIARLASGAAVLAVAMVTWPAAASAAPAAGGLGLDVRTAQTAYRQGEPVRLTFAVTNNSDAACGLAKSPDGTVQVLSVRKDGQELSPVLGRSFYLDGINNAIRSGTVSVPPKSALDVAVVSVRVHDGDEANSVVLRSVAATADGSGLDSLWPIGAPGRYEVTASYAVPPVEGTVPPCAGTTAARTVAFTIGAVGGGFPWVWVGVLAGGLLLLVICVLVIVVLVRRRHRVPAAAVLLLIALVATVGTTGKPAYADYEVDPNSGVPVSGVDFQGAVDNCLQGFSAPGGDPAGIIGRLKDKKTPKVRIIPTTGGSGAFETPQGKDGKGSSTVTWNPTSTDPYGDGVSRDPCAALYHELSHADDISRNTVPQGDCGGTGIKTAEVKATLTENKYRASKGLPPRTEYEGKTLPKSLDDCKKPTKKGPPPKGPVKLCEGTGNNQCGSTNGDPHLVTFDRAYYDLQAVGEFVVVRSTAGDALEVQSRQAPMGTARTVSINSAVAFRLGTHKVELALSNGVTQVRIDGGLSALPRGEKSLPGGGRLTVRESDISAADGYDVRWPDGSAAAVDPIGTYGYRLLVKLDSGRAGKVQGLLGNFDGDPTNDIAPPAGAPLAQPVPFDKLYPAYADSWRIKQNDSLFSYAAGQSTETFTDRGYPAKPMAVTDLSAAQRAQAEAICRWAGVTDPWQLAECVYDVAATGRPEFAVGSADTELVTPPATAPIAATPIASATLTIGGTDRLTFAGKAGQAVFVDIPASSLPDRCSPYRLQDPAGKDLASGCNINSRGYIERTELPADGQYTVLIDATDGVAGRATVRVYAAQDGAGTLVPNGAPVSATIEQPGAVARYRFNGTAGQRVFLDVPESSLPDQCSPLELRDPAGKQIASGCVINGVGDIDGTLLPDDGTYTIVVDPNDRTIGAVQMRLFSAKDQIGTIAVNGQPVVATIGQPGLVLRYRFTSTAGTSITVNMSDATLPDQCSPIQLLDPADKEIDSGCVIYGKGSIDKTVLPDTGTYTIVVDPSGAATGAVTLSLHS